MAATTDHNLKRTATAGFLAWLVPGAGHYYLGERHRAAVFFFVIGATFWGGVAMGSVSRTIDAQHRKAWLVAQIGSGVHALTVLGWQRVQSATTSEYCYQADEVAVVYSGVAGLLNLLVIFDALARGEKPVPVGGSNAPFRARRGET
ncbi:MAG: hypothetical protein GY842_28195 [bacterium]|nr:hypothetical protein [bacterium]